MTEQPIVRESNIVAYHEFHIFFNTDYVKGPPRVTPMADRKYKNDQSRTAMHGYVIPAEGGFITRKAK
jgi:hypothetical protein